MADLQRVIDEKRRACTMKTNINEPIPDLIPPHICFMFVNDRLSPIFMSCNIFHADYNEYDKDYGWR